MSDRIYAWLLRLFPSRFREDYGDDALQLFRDRARDERGSLRTLRLWFDLLADLAISLPREYSSIESDPIGAAVRKRVDGVPSFIVLEQNPPDTAALASGFTISVVVVTMFAFGLIHQVRTQPVLYAHDGYSVGTDVSPSGTGNSDGAQIADDGERTGAGPAKPVAAAAASGTAPKIEESRHSRGSDVAASDERAGKQAQLAQAANEGGFPAAVLQFAQTLSAADRQRVVDEVTQNLKQHYFDQGVAEKLANALQEHLKNGDDDSASDGDALARLLTSQIRSASDDRSVEVVYSTNPLRAAPAGFSAERVAAYRRAMEASNCTFEPVRMLPGNIGYLKLDSFPDPAVCEATARAAMASLNGSKAIIFDLRENRGGQPSMVMLIASYLFDHPEFMFNPREGSSKQSWTQPVAGSQLADKPVYVLTSWRTFSGAEHFSYDLKMLKRATLVGERTGGATDTGVFYRMDDHFGIGLPSAVINPYAEPDWAGVGVEPDAKVNAADALETAMNLAKGKATGPPIRQ